MKNLIKLFICVVAAFTLLSCSSSSTPSAAIMSVYKSLAKGDFKDAISHLYFGRNHTMVRTLMLNADSKEYAEFTDGLKEELEKQGGIISFEVLSEEISEDGENAKINFRTTYGNGEVEDEEFKLILVDGKWLVKIL